MYGSSSNSVKLNSAASASSFARFGRAQRVAGGVLKVGDDVREGRAEAILAQEPLQLVDVDPVGLQLDHPDVRAAVAQVQQRAVVGRGLDDDRVAGVDQQLEQERVGLHRAVGDQHLIDLDPVHLGDVLAQGHIADGRPVRGRPGRIFLEGELRGLAQALHVDDVERRRPAGEGDRVGHGPQDTRVTPRRTSRRRRRASPRRRPATARPPPPAPRVPPRVAARAPRPGRPPRRSRARRRGRR